jgi:hypothetical protein
MEAEQLGGASDQLTIEAGADQDGDPLIAEAVSAG